MRVLDRRYKSINEALAQLAIELVVDGEDIQVQNAVGDTVLTKDLMNYRLTFAPDYCNICTLPERKFPLKNAQAEFLWYMTGNASAEPVSKFMKNWLNYADANGNVNSNYGAYWHKCIPSIIAELKRDKFSRRAVMNIYHSGNAPFGKDTPCTLSLQFLIRDNALHLLYSMRSNDIWYGLSIDQFCSSLLQQLVWHSLLSTYPDLKLGTYQHSAGSMHVYLSESKGNATLTTNCLAQMYQNFASNGEHGKRFELGTEVTFENFWQTASKYFDKTRFDHFKNFIIA